MSLVLRYPPISAPRVSACVGSAVQLRGRWGYWRLVTWGLAAAVARGGRGMTRTAQHRADGSRPLDILDVGVDEERVYRWLLGHPGANVSDIAAGVSLPPRKAQRVLDTIECKGLVTYSPQRPRCYFALSPNTESPADASLTPPLQAAFFAWRLPACSCLAKRKQG